MVDFIVFMKKEGRMIRRLRPVFGFKVIRQKKRTLPEVKQFASIFLFRHGMTFFNRDRKFTGWRDSRLTKQGFDDAKIVALRLKDKKIGVAFHTALTRSKQTLKEVLRFHPETFMVIQDDRLFERAYGKLEGLTHLEFVKKHSPKLYDVYHRSYDTPPPGGESMKMVKERVLSFIKDLLKFVKKHKVNVAISAHGNSMRPFRQYFEKFNNKQMMKLYNAYDAVYEFKVKI